MVVRKDLESGPAYALGIQSLFLDLDEDGYSELAVGAGAAWGYGHRLALGLSFRGLFVGSDLDEVSANGYDIGLGLTFDVSNRERIGVHYPSDSSVGRHLAFGVWDALMKPTSGNPNYPGKIDSPMFHQVLQRAKAEWA